MAQPGHILQNCPACGITFDHDVPKCPDCGTRTEMSRRRILIAVTSALILLAVLIALWAANMTPIPTDF